MSNLLEFAFYNDNIFAGFLPKTIASKSRVGRAGNDSGWEKTVHRSTLMKLIRQQANKFSQIQKIK